MPWPGVAYIPLAFPQLEDLALLDGVRGEREFYYSQQCPVAYVQSRRPHCVSSNTTIIGTTVMKKIFVVLGVVVDLISFIIWS